MVFIDTSGAGTSFKSIAYATNHTLSIGTTSEDVATKDSGGGKWNESTVQKFAWSATTDNLYSLDGAGSMYDDLFTAMTNETLVGIKFTLESTYENKPDSVPSAGWTPISTPPIYAGKARITDLQLNAQDGSNASFTATFTGVGALSNDGTLPS